MKVESHDTEKSWSSEKPIYMRSERGCNRMRIIVYPKNKHILGKKRNSFVLSQSLQAKHNLLLE